MELYYDTTQAFRGPITKINQSKCSIAGPIFSKYWTGHCPEWSRTCVFGVIALFSRVINLLLTKLARDRTGRISALGLFWSVLSRPRADILQVWPSRLVNKIYLLYGTANPSVLIGSFFVGISPYGPFPWKRSQAEYFFFFESPQIQTKHGPSAI